MCCVRVLRCVAYSHLGNNNLVGTIPASIKDLTALKVLVLEWNWLTGVVPALDVDQYDESYCDLAFNMFQCPLPPGVAEKCNAACD